MWESALTRLDVAVALIAILGALKSGYNGHVRKLVRNIYAIGDVKEKVDHMEQRQEKLIDGVVAVSVAESKEDVSVDTDELAQNLRGQSYRLYLQRDGRSNPYAEAEDEEVWEWTDGGVELGEEVDEPE